MSKEEFLKIQTCVLKVNVHCDGCKHKVKKILQKIDGVYTTKIDAEQGKVTVSGNVDPATLIKKLEKSGKHAELWGAPKANNNQQNALNNQFKNLQIGNGKGQNNKNPNQKGGNPQPKSGQNPQVQQLKGFQDLKMPPQFMKDMKMLHPQFMKDMKMPVNGKDQNQKSVPEIDESDDDEFDDSDDDEFDYDDEMDDVPLSKMKTAMGNGHGGGQMPKMMMNNMMNGQHPQFMKGGTNGGNNGGNAGGNGMMMMNSMMNGQHPQFMKGGANEGNAGGKGKMGGGAGNMPMQVNVGGNNNGNCGANFGKKGGNGNNNSGNQNQCGGKGGKNGVAQPQNGKNGGGNGGQNINSNNGNGGGSGANGAKKGGGVTDGFHGMPNMMAMNSINPGGSMGQMGNLPVGQMRPMGNPPMGGQMGNPPMGGQMGNFATVRGLPTNAMNGGGGFQGPSIEHMAGNPYYQQQLAAMMMNQQHANGNERFQPMMYARPPPAVSYMPPYPPYPYPRHPGEQPDQYSMFSDENTSSCSVM
ncbi:heavy metal-associated isoprenylated plant 33-like [Olea europaea subsp. europaea]|uniref:Heavy metal-associated isoprenylated plant 33-like n=2 Tax=Olea europaea subsp. europaea TaxID=158383 RepID=A0A8S0PAR5_OLEEU|nr:heavy metal-associated isoprenylated plant 33-like [Olea europaea subsp. europaea]CAA2938078.1 heavy metal-associated isoprenylated plant 33-like [Olea europaea subsp. europaea]